MKQRKVHMVRINLNPCQIMVVMGGLALFLKKYLNAFLIASLVLLVSQIATVIFV